MGRHYAGASAMWLFLIIGVLIAGGPLWLAVLLFVLGFPAVGIISAVWDWTDRQR